MYQQLFYNTGTALYSAAIALLAPFHRKAAQIQAGRRQTFDYLQQHVQPGETYLWFHAASLGEFEQGRPVMEALKERHPEARIILTFFSPSGYEIRKNYAGADLICYLPADTHANACRLLQLIPVKAAVFIKYEFWPNYLTELNRRGIPAYSIAAIFRNDQLFFKSYGNWYRQVLYRFRKIFVQDEGSLQLLQSLNLTNAVVAGDTRFDRVKAVAATARQFPEIEEFIGNCRQVIIAGSSWPQDEELLARYLNEHPDTKLILVPHEIHESHLAGIAKLVPESRRYTHLKPGEFSGSRCLVIDTIGMLSAVYQYATIAYIGGGFGVGIHNTLEAAVWKVPVVFGPNYMKFREARELIAVGGGFSIGNYEELKQRLNGLVEEKKAIQLTEPFSSGKATGSGTQAGNYVDANTGATLVIINQLTNDLYAKTIHS